MARLIDLIKQGSKIPSGSPEGTTRKPSPPEPSAKTPKPPSEEGEAPVKFPSADTFTAGRTPPSAPKTQGTTRQGAPREGESLHSPTHLEVKARYCPYLGGKRDRAHYHDYPNPSNVCYAKESREKKLLRTIILSYSAIPAMRQREFCLSTFTRCPIYKAKEKNGGED